MYVVMQLNTVFESTSISLSSPFFYLTNLCVTPRVAVLKTICFRTRFHIHAGLMSKSAAQFIPEHQNVLHGLRHSWWSRRSDYVCVCVCAHERERESRRRGRRSSRALVLPVIPDLHGDGFCRPSTPLVHNHGGTWRRQAVTAVTPDRPPDYTGVTTINNPEHVRNLSRRARQPVDIIMGVMITGVSIVVIVLIVISYYISTLDSWPPRSKGCGKLFWFWTI